jgi:hypothetical protein
LICLTACGGDDGLAGPDAPELAIDAAADAVADAAIDAPAGFGALSGMCGALDAMDATSTEPQLVRATMSFERAYVDPDDRDLLTPGGLHLAETPNAGGSSGLSEVFAYEELARCEHAELLKTETEIVYDTVGKITDLEVEVAGHKLGVSVTRAVPFPFDSTYTLDAATMLVEKKLGDIQMSTANVSAGDRWDKQILAVLAWDQAAADTFAQAWTLTDAALHADTIVLITTTDGADEWIYTNGG